MNAIIEQRPELKEKLLGRLEANYQYLLARETATLRLTRKLSDGEYRTSNITSVALDEDALATLSPASTDNKTNNPTGIKKAGFRQLLRYFAAAFSSPTSPIFR
ncbi:putative cytoplasmic protein [Enterobacter cloacae]|uniref:Putative cytoplasmic protein n=1 Tax=Enterobacter cloacae TaxID=550 RepID=A0A377LSG8_ENTCL|nr:putative cytoplasmic protein [Enterobacter cloacae]